MDEVPLKLMTMIAKPELAFLSGSSLEAALDRSEGGLGIGLAAAAEAADDAAAPRSVLLADDNRDSSDALAELLRMYGHVVHTAHDGTQAAELALLHRPDVLVLDIGMPGLNGYEVAQRVRAQPWGARPFLIAATGWSQEDDRQKATAAGFDLHLTKPFDPKLLTDLIAQHAR
jgi:CheY-like chemotaxis protein